MGADDHQTIVPYGPERNLIDTAGVTSMLDRASRAAERDDVKSWFVADDGEEVSIIMSFKTNA